jgi:hypothetical protein
MPPETLPPTEPSTPAEISRRKLLKMLTVAGAGASTAVLLSGQWVKPVAAGGKLAPHAQTSQSVTHTIVSGSAEQISSNGTQKIQAPAANDLSATCTISPADPNIPMVATANVLRQVPAQASAPQIVTALQKTANTNASGVASFTFTDAELGITCQNLASGVEVVFSFANAADGSGTLKVMAPWSQPC